MELKSKEEIVKPLLEVLTYSELENFVNTLTAMKKEDKVLKPNPMITIDFNTLKKHIKGKLHSKKRK